MYFDLNRTKSPQRKNRHLIIALASLVLVSSAVAIPEASMGAKGKVVESPAAPEAGVELLESILHRIGTDSQIAEKKKKPTAIAMAPPAETDALASMQQQQQAGFDQMVDPAYVIRPKQRAEKAQKRASMDGLKIAAAPPAVDLSTFAARRSMSNTAGPAGNKYADSDLGFSSTTMEGVGGFRSGGAGATRGMSPQNAQRLSRDLGNLSGILNKMNTMQQAPQGLPPVAWGKSVSSPGDNFYMGGAAPGAANVREIVPTSASRPVQISKAGNVYDYRQAAAESKKFEENRIAAAPAAPSAAAGSLAGGYAADEEGGDTTSMKLDKPSSYRNDQVIKEYAPEPEQEKAKDKSSVGTKSFLDSKNEAARARSRKQLLAQRPAQFAFMPPSLVAGIPQLKLGATNNEATAFMATHGKFKSKMVNGWTVWSLTNASTGKTDLQIFIRRGTVEGFRIFNPAFVPERLGVNLSGTLQNVKEKFGEPAFWMYEPSSGKEKNIKNLVYPVNQISFQMARSGKDNEAVVQSLLMFKFL